MPPKSLRNNSFPRAFRFQKSRDYRRLYEKPEVFRLGSLLIFRKASDLGHFRVGVTIKGNASSIQRNRIKRAVREFFRTHAPALGSFDYNLFVGGQKSAHFDFKRAKRIATDLQSEFLSSVSGKKAGC